MKLKHFLNFFKKIKDLAKAEKVAFKNKILGLLLYQWFQSVKHLSIFSRQELNYTLGTILKYKQITVLSGSMWTKEVIVHAI